MRDIRTYLLAEYGRRDFDLFFGRTAAIKGVHFWLWAFLHRARRQYVLVSAWRGRSLLNAGGGEQLSPEESIQHEFTSYWSVKLREHAHARSSSRAKQAP